jgi:hypothetical protein
VRGSIFLSVTTPSTRVLQTRREAVKGCNAESALKTTAQDAWKHSHASGVLSMPPKYGPVGGLTAGGTPQVPVASVQIASVQKTTIRGAIVKTVEENEGLLPHIPPTHTPDFLHAYR